MRASEESAHAVPRICSFRRASAVLAEGRGLHGGSSLSTGHVFPERWWIRCRPSGAKVFTARRLAGEILARGVADSTRTWKAQASGTRGSTKPQLLLLECMCGARVGEVDSQGRPWPLRSVERKCFDTYANSCFMPRRVVAALAGPACNPAGCRRAAHRPRRHRPPTRWWACCPPR